MAWELGSSKLQHNTFIPYEIHSHNQKQSYEFLFGELSCDANIFVKTTLTHTYIYIYTHTHAFLLYTHTFLFDKLYNTHTQPKKKKKELGIFN